MTTTEPGPHETGALITIETAERLARHAAKAIAEGDTGRALDILDALTEETTRRTCTRVKSLALSDHIADGARFRVGYHLALINAQRNTPPAEEVPGGRPATTGDHRTGWVIHYLAHTDCPDCERLIDDAITTARATGSIGATVTDDPAGHEATIRRAPVGPAGPSEAATTPDYA
jgi:hypothetical protein